MILPVKQQRQSCLILPPGPSAKGFKVSQVEEGWKNFTASTYQLEFDPEIFGFTHERCAHT